MSRYWSSLVHRLTPYVPGEQPKLPNLVKLNTNENPYPPSAQVVVAIADELANGGRSLRLYPDPNAERLKEAVAARYAGFGIRPQQVFVGNGSDEVLAHIFPALLKHTLPVLFPDITYSFYPVYCGLYDMAYRTVPLDEEFTIRVEDYAMANGGIIFPNPNAPTGCLLPLADIERLLLLHRESVVVVDEAYIDFGGDSAIALVDRHPNLLVVHTLSKSRSLAGLRVGYAVGQDHLTEALERVKNSFNSYPLDRLALTGAVAAIDDQRRGAELESLIAGLEKKGWQLGGDQVKTAPRGFAKDHPRISLLRHRSMTLGRDHGFEGLDSPGVVDWVRRDWRELKPFVDYLTRPDVLDQ